MAEPTVDDLAYERAAKDPAARVILDALLQQDARTYNGLSGSIGRLALTTASLVRQVVAQEIESGRRGADQ